MDVPIWIAIAHDWRKFLLRQWTPYAENFFNVDGTKRTVRDTTGAYDPNAQSLAFQLAWLDHQQAKHHWQAWCVIGDGGKLKALYMPEVYIREMIADWMSAGIVYGNYGPHKWFQANREKMVLHEETLKNIHWLLKIFTPVENPLRKNP